MTKLNLEGLKDSRWEDLGIQKPGYDVMEARKETKEQPVWVHFGAGNIFRAYIAHLQHELLQNGKAKSGIVALESFDGEIIEKIYRPHDDLTLLVTMKEDGTLEKKIHAGIGESLIASAKDEAQWARLNEIFAKESLQLCSFTITEKGYALQDFSGNELPAVKMDMEKGPERPQHVISIIVSLLKRRFDAGAKPIALVSMDNCSRNGDRLKAAVLSIAKAWREKGFVEDDFMSWIEDEQKVSFPLSMIDKITPSPVPAIAEQLAKEGIEGIEIITTERKTVIAPYANAEEAEYLVIEDKFPNGRPALEEVGVYFTDRDTVDKSEKMKVSACLNPIHTAMVGFGRLLDFDTVDELMRDPLLLKYLKRLGYDEALKVVDDPGIINPKAFLDEVMEKRFPNPHIHDTLYRIATDASQGMGVRFCTTIRKYMERSGLSTDELLSIPLAIAGWCRYLMAVDDHGQEIKLSPDPLIDSLTEAIKGVRLGEPQSYQGDLKAILKNEQIFTVDLYATNLGERIEGYFLEMIADKGAVKKTLEKYFN